MLKKLITALLLFVSFGAIAQTQTAQQNYWTFSPTGSSSFTPTWRFIGSNTDSIAMKAYFSNGTSFWRAYTAAQQNVMFAQTAKANIFTKPQTIPYLTLTNQSSLPAPASGSTSIGFITDALTYKHGDNGWQRKFMFSFNGDEVVNIPAAASVNLVNSAGITGGSCTSCNLSYNSDGLITVAANGSGGGSITGGANGLSASGANIVLGGTLTGNTSIANGGSYLRSDSTYSGKHTVYATPSGGLYVFGTSIAAGSTLSGGTPWPQTTANAIGLTLHNFAGSGNTVENRSPSNPAGGVSFLTQTGSIPTYSGLTGTNYMLIEPGPNDWHSGYTNYNPTNYVTDLTTFLGDVLAAGWPANHVFVLNNSYVNPTTYGITGAGGNTILQSVYQTFQADTKSVTASEGMNFIDVFAAFANGLNIGYLGIGDVLHPAQIGANFEGNFVASQINNGAVYAVQPGTIYGASQVGTFNGPVAASYLNLGTSIALSNAASNTLLGRNSHGDVASLQALPPGTISGATFIWNGKQKYLGIDTTNITLGPQDIVMPTGIKENYAYVPNNTYYGTLTKGTSIIGLDYTIHTYSNPTGSMFSLNSPSGTAFSVNQNGTASFLGAVTASAIITPFNGAGISASTSGNSGGLLPFGTDLAGTGTWTAYLNYIGVGGFEFKTAKSILGSYTEAMKIDNATQNVTIGVPAYYTGATTAAASGFSLEVAATARTDGNAYFGVVTPPTSGIAATPSGSGGTLAAGNKFYVYTTIDANGNESNKSAEVSCTTSGTTSSVSVAFTPPANGVSWRLYQGTTTGNETKYITGTTSPIVDIGSGYTTQAPPAAGVNKTYLSSISGTTGAASFTNVASTQATADLTAQTSAGNVATFTVGASTATFNVSTYINVTAVSVDVIQGQITYTDENNASQTISLSNISAIGNSTYSPVTIRAKNATVITVKTNLTTGAGTITFDTGARIQQL